MDTPFLNQQMRCSIISNANGDIVILHDQPLESEVQWIDFDVVNKSLSIVYEDGSSQFLGIQISDKMVGNLKNGTEVQLALLEGEQFTSVYKTTIVIQEY